MTQMWKFIEALRCEKKKRQSRWEEEEEGVDGIYQDTRTQIRFPRVREDGVSERHIAVIDILNVSVVWI